MARVTYVTYTCQCGSRTTTIGLVPPSCPFCGVRICKRCTSTFMCLSCMQLVTEDEKAEYLHSVRQRNRSGSAAGLGVGLFCIGIVLTVLFIFLYRYYLWISINMIIGGIILGKFQEKKTNKSAVDASNIGIRIGRAVAERRALSIMSNFPPPNNIGVGGPGTLPPRFCANCGHPAKQDTLFCQYCGARLL